MAADSLLTLLNQRLDAGLRSREWLAEKNGLTDQRLSRLAEDTGEALGDFLLCRAPFVGGLWGTFRTALSKGKILVLLPHLSNAEESILLRQLPSTPPPGAVLALFTSGSTGHPKAVFHSEISLLASGGQLQKAFGDFKNTASLLPAWGMAGVAFHFLLPLMHGESHLYSRESALYWSAHLDQALRDTETKLLTLNPYILEMWLQSEPGLWAGSVVSLTAPLSESVKQKFRVQSTASLEEVYGLTEAAGPVLKEGCSLGAKTRLTESGELQLAGKQLFLGYSSEGKFEPRPEWFATGDQFREESGLKFVSRMKELINLGGRKVAPALIEEVFLAMPEVESCVAFEKMERIGLVYVRTKECTLSKKDLSRQIEEWARNSLSVELRPSWWREIEKLPRLPSGKTDRKKIRTEQS